MRRAIDSSVCEVRAMLFMKTGFAELNAANPIFVEDAARLFYEQLQQDPRVGDFRIIASHQESLHSHDAISVLTQGTTFAQSSLDPRTFDSLFHVG